MKITKEALKRIVLEELQSIDERCQKGYKTHPTRKTKQMFGRTYRNCVKAEGLDEVADEEPLDEKKRKKKKKKKSGGKKDACYHKVKARYDVWPSAYASGALVKCRKVGAKNWGKGTTKEEQELDEESLHQWFKGGGWKQAGGKYDGKPCARQPGQKTTPKCVSRSKYKSMSKKERDSAARRKRKKDPGQTKKTGAAKPTYVKTDPQKGGKKKKKESLNMNKQRLQEIVLEEIQTLMLENAYYEFLAEGETLEEAEYQGRKVTLNKPMKGDVKKSKVYVKNAKGNVVKVNFGDKNMKIKKSNPKRRKSFRARHNCKNPGPKWKARYWSCKAW